jgi:hypothetical protein
MWNSAMMPTPIKILQAVATIDFFSAFSKNAEKQKSR